MLMRFLALPALALAMTLGCACGCTVVGAAVGGTIPKYDKRQPLSREWLTMEVGTHLTANLKRPMSVWFCPTVRAEDCGRILLAHRRIGWPRRGRRSLAC